MRRIDCILPAECAPEADGWPACLPTELAQEGETPEETYARLVAQAPNTFECVDERGLDGSNSMAGDTLWCRNLGSKPAASNPIVLHGNRLEELVVSFLGEELGGEVFAVIRSLQLLPTDGHPHTMHQWGLSDVDGGAALGMNFGFEAKHLSPSKAGGCCSSGRRSERDHLVRTTDQHSDDHRADAFLGPAVDAT